MFLQNGDGRYVPNFDLMPDCSTVCTGIVRGSYGTHLLDRLSLTLLCQALGVSKSAAIIRLRQLGYIEDRPLAEYDDPLEVWL